ncbi:terpenoid cyclases/protein prenyltransferase alpha-alpha toroid [Gorgonomyces haynaldii]|nr:terpenoid cyclases/protein prenyltransferase alpha-alpha toroid [Gorgonomyces haynaldii]
MPAENWRLKVEHGRQTWHYEENTVQTQYDKYWLGTLKDKTVYPKPKNALDAARNGTRFFSKLQTDDGHFAGEYGGPMFLIPGIVITMYITKQSFPKGYTEEFIRYLKNRAHKEDGGWGIHIEGHSTVFGTALNYVALRLLGVPAHDPVCVKARNTLWKLGGATGAPAWGKFWLSVLNVYDWDGNNSIPPELWIVPEFLPIHAGRMWCHTRLVYLPMGYLYGIRFQAPLDDLILQLREELYPEPYETINWKQQRNNVSAADVYFPHTPLLNFLNGVLGVYEMLPNSFIRKHALAKALEQIRYEDENSDYLDIGPVNKAMNMLIVWIVDGPESESFKRHLARVPDFMWMSQDGMMMNGTNGSQLWDTAFAMQAFIESGLAQEKEFHDMSRKALDFIDDMQMRKNPRDYKKCYRQITKGAWPFSNRDQNYTVSDCTAEGLKAVLLSQSQLGYVGKPVSDDRLFDAINVLLTMQNADDGFASYELIRGPQWLENLNPAEVFGNIMIEYSYPECTTSVLLGLCAFRELYPDHRPKEIQKTIERSISYIRKSQLPDGSWFGSWGICFTYATFFAVESLVHAGEIYKTSPQLQKACEFLASKQMSDGGWGESYKACETGVWVNHEQSQVVQTAWALLSLMAARYPNKQVIDRGIKLIMSRQLPNGSWAQEAIEGVFNKNCMISYPNYKFIFTIWALGRYHNQYEK